MRAPRLNEQEIDGTLLNAVAAVYGETERPVTVSEVQEYLGQSSRAYSHNWVGRGLRRLFESGALKRERMGPALGNNKLRTFGYCIPAQGRRDGTEPGGKAVLPDAPAKGPEAGGQGPRPVSAKVVMTDGRGGKTKHVLVEVPADFDITAVNNSLTKALGRELGVSYDDVSAYREFLEAMQRMTPRTRELQDLVADCVSLAYKRIDSAAADCPGCGESRAVRHSGPTGALCSRCGLSADSRRSFGVSLEMMKAAGGLKE